MDWIYVEQGREKKLSTNLNGYRKKGGHRTRWSDVIFRAIVAVARTFKVHLFWEF